jgi:putative membrane protein
MAGAAKARPEPFRRLVPRRKLDGMRGPDFRFQAYGWSSFGEPRRLDRANWLALLVRWLMLAFSVWVAAEVVGGIELEGIPSILAVAAILGLFNLYLRPFLFIVSLPFTIVTLGLFIIVINAILLGLTDWVGNLIDLRFSVDGVWSALLGALVISLVNMMLTVFLRPKPVS